MNTSKSVKNKKKSMAEWSAVLAMYSLVEVKARSEQAPDTTVVFKIRSRHTMIDFLLLGPVMTNIGDVLCGL